MGQVKVFISYAKEDIKVAEKLYHDLKDARLEPWMDTTKLLGGQRWQATIKDAIKNSSYFLALLSENSVSKKGFVQKEVKFALDELGNYPPDEIYMIPVRLDKSEPTHDELKELHWIDIFPSYKKGLKNILRVLYSQKNNSEPERTGSIRLYAKNIKRDGSTSYAVVEKRKRVILILILIVITGTFVFLYDANSLSEEEVKAILKQYDLFDRDWNESGNFKNDFADNKDSTITDSMTGLMWQKSGSDDEMIYNRTQTYIDYLNRQKFAGYNNWRLPILKELASLLKNTEVYGHYTDPLFDRKQQWCWSADKRTSEGAWGIYFNDGYVNWNSGRGYVRAVRTLTD